MANLATSNQELPLAQPLPSLSPERGEWKRFIFKIRRWDKFYIRARAKLRNGTAVVAELELLDKQRKPIHTEIASTQVKDEWIAQPFVLNEIAAFKNDREKLKQVCYAQGKIKVPSLDKESPLRTRMEVVHENILRYARLKPCKILNEIAEYGKDSSGRSVLKEGDAGQEVGAIALCLWDLKVAAIFTGAKYDERLTMAVKRFQSAYVLAKDKEPLHKFDRNLKVDGIIGKNTILALDEAGVRGWKDEKEWARQQIIRSGNVVSRIKWGKLTAKININGMKNDWDYTTIVVHHTVGESKTAIAYLQQEEKDHMSKWADVGYHYIIAKDGTIYEGRSIYYQGAHTGNVNPSKIGISLIGNFMETKPTDQQVNSLIKHVNILKKYFTSINVLGGHKDWGKTLCPGDYLYALLDNIRDETKLSSPNGKS
jgi:hypothetical protein